MAIHFPFVEAGRVRSLCGEPRSKNAWTTKQDAVTCPLCHRLLGLEAQQQTTVSPRPISVSAAGQVAKPRL